MRRKKANTMHHLNMVLVLYLFLRKLERFHIVSNNLQLLFELQDFPEKAKKWNDLSTAGPSQFILPGHFGPEGFWYLPQQLWAALQDQLLCCKIRKGLLGMLILWNEQPDKPNDEKCASSNMLLEVHFKILVFLFLKKINLHAFKTENSHATNITPANPIIKICWNKNMGM